MQSEGPSKAPGSKARVPAAIDADLTGCDGPQGEQALVLGEVVQAVATKRTLEEVHQALAQTLRRIARFDRISIMLVDAARDLAWLHLYEGEVAGLAPQSPREFRMSETPQGEVYRTRKPLVIEDMKEERQWPPMSRLAETTSLRSCLIVPLIVAQRFLGTLGFFSSEVAAYSKADLKFMDLVSSIVAVAVDNAINFEKLTALTTRLSDEKLYLEQELRSEGRFREIVGESKALRQVLEQVRTVAPTDAAVLILGETGTGKELIARAIHEMGGRKGGAFVKLNCAAIPTGLLESELFGHEKGAFTGATAQKRGRYELAHQGTLFLDEVGDIPLELQPKLLRVLQEQEFERLGGTQTIKVDVRLVAATNQDLDRMILEKKFRSDLFYRLNVFPIRIPPLRERREDIPLLVRYFVALAARKMKKEITAIPPAAMDLLTRAPWPGNIRELENFIERAVIMSKGNDLAVPLAELGSAGETRLPRAKPGGILMQGERETILRALRDSNWVVSGPHGAAAKLGLKRGTLHYKMRKFDLRKPQ